MLRQTTFQEGGVTGTVHGYRGADVWDRIVVLRKLGDEADKNELRAGKFAEFVTQTDVVSGLPFEWVTPASSADEIQIAYQVWCDVRPALMITWANAINDADAAPGDEATAPGIDPKNSQPPPEPEENG